MCLTCSMCSSGRNMQAKDQAQFNSVTSSLEPSGWLCLQQSPKLVQELSTQLHMVSILPWLSVRSCRKESSLSNWMQKVHSPVLNSRHDTSHYQHFKPI